MHKLMVFTAVVMSGLVLVSCQFGPPAASTQTPGAVDQKMAPDAKQGTTSKTGTVTKTGSGFFLQTQGSAPLGIDSYSVDLEQYVGKTVTVTGQYSGDTLFVGSIQ